MVSADDGRSYMHISNIIHSMHPSRGATKPISLKNDGLHSYAQLAVVPWDANSGDPLEPMGSSSDEMRSVIVLW